MASAKMAVSNSARSWAGSAFFKWVDEPTAALSDRESEKLFEVVRQLRAEGLAIIYISHRMAEVYDLADRLSVFRDGSYVGELKRPEFSADKVINMMVGRRLEDFYEHTIHPTGKVLLKFVT